MLGYLLFWRRSRAMSVWLMLCYLCTLIDVASVSQLCYLPFIIYITWDVVKIALLATHALNAIMPLSHASTCGRYSRIEGVTSST